MAGFFVFRAPSPDHGLPKQRSGQNQRVNSHFGGLLVRKLLILLIFGLVVISPVAVFALGMVPDTQGLLSMLETTVSSRSLRIGDRGEAVTQLQGILESLGHNPGPVDGIFGPLTESAVKRYQAAVGVTVDGSFGRQSLLAATVEEGLAPARRLVISAQPEAPATVPAQAFALTFNGKIDASLLPGVIATLTRHGFGATFFIPGEDVERNPNQVISLVEAGYKVAPLGFAEVDMARLTPHLITSQTRMARNAVAKVTGEEPEFFRPPFGRFTSAMTDLIEQEGLKMVMWTNVTIRETAPDWPQRLADSVYPGAVVMLRHDLADTVQRLDLALSELRRAGYRGVSLTDLYDNGPSDARIGAKFDERFPYF